MGIPKFFAKLKILGDHIGKTFVMTGAPDASAYVGMKLMASFDVSGLKHTAIEGHRNARGCNSDSILNSERFYKLKTERLRVEDLEWNEFEISKVVTTMVNKTMDHLAELKYEKVYLVLDGMPSQDKVRCQIMTDELYERVMRQLTIIYDTCDANSVSSFVAYYQHFDRKGLRPEMAEMNAKMFIRFASIGSHGWEEATVKYIKNYTTRAFAHYLMDHIDEIRDLPNDVSTIWYRVLLHMVRGHYPAPEKQITEMYCQAMMDVWAMNRANWYSYRRGNSQSEPEEYIGEMQVLQADSEADFEIARLAHEWKARGKDHMAHSYSGDSDQGVIGAGMLLWDEPPRPGNHGARDTRVVFIDLFWGKMVEHFAKSSVITSKTPIEDIVHSIIYYLCHEGTDYSGRTGVGEREAIGCLKEGVVTNQRVPEVVLKIWQPYIETRIAVLYQFFEKVLPKWQSRWKKGVREQKTHAKVFHAMDPDEEEFLRNNPIPPRTSKSSKVAATPSVDETNE